MPVGVGHRRPHPGRQVGHELLEQRQVAGLLAVEQLGGPPLGANGPLNFATLAPTLAGNGYRVFFLTYGTGVLGPTVGGIGPMADSAAKVAHFVGFGANYAGTSLDGLATLLHLGPVLTGVGCAACAEYLPDSAFLTKLNAGGVAVPGPTYTNIVSRYDQVVTPYTSGVFTAPNATDIVIQDRCGLDFTGHLGQAVDPNVAALVLNTLDPSSPVHCQPFFDAGA